MILLILATQTTSSLVPRELYEDGEDYSLLHVVPNALFSPNLLDSHLKEEGRRRYDLQLGEI